MLNSKKQRILNREHESLLKKQELVDRTKEKIINVNNFVQTCTIIWIQNWKLFIFISRSQQEVFFLKSLDVDLSFGF